MPSSVAYTLQRCGHSIWRLVIQGALSKQPWVSLKGIHLARLFFSLTLSQALTCLEPTDTRPSLGTIDAYADDAFLCTSPENAGPAFLRWQDRLQESALMRLKLLCGNRTPTNCLRLFNVIFRLSASASQASPYVDFPLKLHLILSPSTSLLATAPSFKSFWINNLLVSLFDFPCSSFSDYHSPASPALHIALTLIRSNLQNSWAHLRRYLIIYHPPLLSLMLLKLMSSSCSNSPNSRPYPRISVSQKTSSITHLPKVVSTTCSKRSKLRFTFFLGLWPSS